MKRKRLIHVLAGLVASTLMLQTAAARLYDNFDTGTNWMLFNDSGTADIGSSVLTLTSPAGALSGPTASLKPTQSLTGTRQSILVRSHSGVANSTVFFLWANDLLSSNKLELKLDDVNPTTVVAGYYTGGGTVYHFVGSAAYSPGPDGLYMAFQESNNVTFWQISTDAVHWTSVASMSDPVSTSSMIFEVQHKAYVDTATATASVVDCFNYKATGAGYHSLEDKTTSGGTNWELYTEGFSGGDRICASDLSTHCDTVVNDVDSTQHFTDTSIPAPFTNQSGYHFEIVSTDGATTHDYYNAYRYQTLPYVEAETWIYHLYFKYAYPQFITQGLEFPINKYTGTNRLQAAFAWYPLRNGTDTGLWKVWTGTTWLSTTFEQALQTNQWYEITFTVGMHDNQVFYNGFEAGNPHSLTPFAWSHTYSAPGDGHSANIVPAMQMDDNNQDTTQANTRKDAYLSEWHIDWQDEKLP